MLLQEAGDCALGHPFLTCSRLHGRGLRVVIERCLAAPGGRSALLPLQGAYGRRSCPAALNRLDVPAGWSAKEAVVLAGIIVGILVGIIVGFAVGAAYQRKQAAGLLGSAHEQARAILEDSRRQAETTQREAAVEARDAALQSRQAAEATRRELDQSMDEQRRRLEQIATMTAVEAKGLLMKQIEEEAKRDAMGLVRDLEQQAREEAERRARKIVTLAIQRVASEQTSESTVAVLPLPSDDMK